MKNILTQIQEEFERKIRKIPENKRYVFTLNFITKSNLRVIEKMKEMVEEEKSRWNSNGEYYDNVTKALDNLKFELSTLNKNK